MTDCVKTYFDAFNAGDTDAMAGCLTDSCSKINVRVCRRRVSQQSAAAIEAHRHRGQLLSRCVQLCALVAGCGRQCSIAIIPNAWQRGQKEKEKNILKMREDAIRNIQAFCSED